jgi:hypothetical protein
LNCAHILQPLHYEWVGVSSICSHEFPETERVTLIRMTQS